MRRGPIKGAGAELTDINTLKWGEGKKNQKSILNDSSESQKMTAAQIDGGGRGGGGGGGEEIMV